MKQWTGMLPDVMDLGPVHAETEEQAIAMLLAEALKRISAEDVIAWEVPQALNQERPR